MHTLTHSCEVKPCTEASPTRSARRGFLLALSAGGIGAAVAAAHTLATPVAAVTPQPHVAANPKGYQETAHVRQYYEKARI